MSHAGAALMAEIADRLGLTSALDRALAGLRERAATHSPGRVIRDLAVMLADGGDALCDLRAVRDQQALFGPVASDSTAYRLIDRIAGDPDALEALRAARARGPGARVAAAARGRERIVIDLDATLMVAHSDKEGAAGNFKGGFGFHPMLAYLDGSRGGAGRRCCGPATPAPTPPPTRSRCSTPRSSSCPSASRRASAILRPRRRGRRDARALIGFCRDGRHALLGRVRPHRAGPHRDPRAARGRVGAGATQDGEERDGAQVAEITDVLDLSDWPDGSRVIVRRERPHPGAQLSFTDHDGHRFQAILTDLPDATSPTWRRATAATRASRTASAPARTPAWTSSRSATSR